MQIAWYQQIVLVPAQAVARVVGRIATGLEILAAAVGWVGRAVRDPNGVGGVADVMHRELREASRATPTYIPDRIFSEVIFAVLKEDKSALRRLRNLISDQVSQLQAQFDSLRVPDSIALLEKQLATMVSHVGEYAADSQEIFTSIRKARADFAGLAALLPGSDPSYQPALDLLRPIAAPLATPVEPMPPGSVEPVPPGPVGSLAPPAGPAAAAETVRLRLSDAVKDLPDGPARRELSRLVGSSTVVGRVSSLYRTWRKAEDYLVWLRASLDESDKARRAARSTARRAVAVAWKAVRASSPTRPNNSKIRDHVFRTLDTSLQRLRAGVGTLPDGLGSPLQTELAAAVARLEAVRTSQHPDASALASLQAEAKRIFASLQGVLDGLKNQIDSSTVADWIDREARSIVAAEGNLLTIAKLRDSVNALPDSQVKAALTALADEAADDLDRVKRNIETWYNDSMDRVSGWYKRNTQIIVAVVSTLVVVSLNADSLSFAGRLWADNSLRGQIVLSGEKESKTSVPGAGILANSPVQPGGAPVAASYEQASKAILARFPVGWTTEEASKLGISGAFLADLPKLTPSKVLDRDNLFRYSARARAGLSRVFNRLFLSESGLKKLVGLAITAIAVSMGAPFWFDLINKLVNVRSAGLRPRKTEDAPTDGQVLAPTLGAAYIIASRWRSSSEIARRSWGRVSSRCGSCGPTSVRSTSARGPSR